MLNGSLDLANDVFNLSLSLCLVVFFLANVLLDNILNNDAHLRGVESKKIKIKLNIPILFLGF